MSEKGSELSSLYAQEKHHKNKIEYWKKQKKDVDANLNKHLEQLLAIQKRLNKIVNRTIRISNHAVQRYSERVTPGASAADILKLIVTPRFENQVRTLGSGEYCSDDGELRIIVEDFTIITITDNIKHKKK